VAAFTKAYRKARELVLEQNELQQAERDGLKGSVLDKLNRLNNDAKSRPHKTFKKHNRNQAERD
jgi:hypothetical protein